MAQQTINKKVWRKLEDGTMELVSDTNIQVDVPTNEELIAEKEAKLLEIYSEIQQLKGE